MARRETSDRQPEFTNTQYEIPSWQTPWNIPWYQRENSSNDDVQKRFKYNDRGHLNDCTCPNCEDDLEKAFSPHSDSTAKTVSDIPKDRHQEVLTKIQDHLKDLNIKHDQKSSSSSSSNAQNAVPKKVFLLSDLEDVTTNTTSNNLATLSTTTTSNSNARTTNSREYFSSSFAPTSNATESSESNATSTHDSVMDIFDNISAIQAISEQTKDIQTRVYNFCGNSSSQEYKTMRDLLLALKRELTRIHSNVEWFAYSKGMALDAIAKTLQILDQRAKQNDDS